MGDLRELRAAEAIVAGTSDAAILLDRDGRYLCHNAAFAEASGARRRQLRRVVASAPSPLALLGTPDGTEAEHLARVVESGSPVHLAEIEVRSWAGTTYTVKQSFVPVPDRNGDVCGVIILFRDVTAEARVQARYREMLEREKARVDDLERRVAERTEQLSAALEELKRLSTRDPLTGLLNRRAFDEFAEQAWQMAERHHRTLGVIVCDLDHFKQVNDTFGHPAGDAVLAATARELSDAVRTTDKVARFGGEEFVILLTETAANAVEIVANRCADRIRALPMADIVPGFTGRQTVSIGVAVYPQHGRSLEELIANADTALYRAKNSGRDRVVVYREGEAEPPVLQSRLLLVDPDPRRRAQYQDYLGDLFHIVACDSGIDALAYAARQPFDVIVADENAGCESGVSFLRKSVAYLPSAVRVLVIGSQDVYLAVRATNSARVDHFLLRDEGPEMLAEAIDHALLKRELVRKPRLPSPEELDQRIDPASLEGLQQILSSRRLPCARQPIVTVPEVGAADTGQRVFAVEALARPEHAAFCAPHPNPEKLFDVASRTGLLWELGRVARANALIGVEALERDVLLFINLHPGELKNEQLLREETALDLHAHRIVFEITERMAIPDGPRLSELLVRLRARGYRIAVDDLGAGYAGLNSLAILAPDFLKIEKSLIRDIQSSTVKQSLVRSVVHFADAEGILVVAEGVETREEAEVVRDLGCHLQQGYLHGRPALPDIGAAGADDEGDAAPAPLRVAGACNRGG